jgi:hypothetical protein
MPNSATASPSRSPDASIFATVRDLRLARTTLSGPPPPPPPVAPSGPAPPCNKLSRLSLRASDADTREEEERVVADGARSPWASAALRDVEGGLGWGLPEGTGGVR